MTREEVIKELEKMKKLNYTLAPLEVFDMAIKALWAVEHMPTTKNDLKVLDKIRSEIKALPTEHTAYGYDSAGELWTLKLISSDSVLDILDKYKAESEENMEEIELVIKMPKEKYDAIKSDLYCTFPAEIKEWGLDAIRNGTPLPKTTAPQERRLLS